MEDCKKRTIIDNRTAVSIGLVVTIIGAVWFISSLFYKVDSNTDRIDKLESAVNQMSEIQSDINVIKSKLDNIEKRIGG